LLETGLDATDAAMKVTAAASPPADADEIVMPISAPAARSGPSAPGDRQATRRFSASAAGAASTSATAEGLVERRQ
jgi:hypothetical protein